MYWFLINRQLFAFVNQSYFVKSSVVNWIADILRCKITAFF